MESFGRTSMKNKLTNSSQRKHTGAERTKRGKLVRATHTRLQSWVYLLFSVLLTRKTTVDKEVRYVYCYINPILRVGFTNRHFLLQLTSVCMSLSSRSMSKIGDNLFSYKIEKLRITQPHSQGSLHLVLQSGTGRRELWR